MMNDQTLIPWYKHHWVWIVIGLLSTAVIASFITLFIAIKHAPEVMGSNIREQVTTTTDSKK